MLSLALAAALTAQDLQPYFADTERRAALEHYQRSEYRAAKELFSRALRRDKISHRLQTEFLHALSLEHDGDTEEATRRFLRLATRYPLLAPYHFYHAARSCFHAGDFEQAVEHSQKVPEASLLAEDALLLQGDALGQLGRVPEAAAIYAKYLERYPKGAHEVEVSFKLAEAEEKQGHPASDRFMKVWSQAPLEWGVQAESHLDHPAEHATAPQWIERATALFDSMRNGASEQAFVQALRSPGLNPELECTARFQLAQSVYKQRNRTRAAPLYEQAFAACAKTANEDLKAKALYQLARCQYSMGQYPVAAETFLRVERDFPKSSYADDSRLRTAEAYAEVADTDPRIDETLSELVTRYPEGDMRQEALWRLAFRAWRRNEPAKALEWLDQALRLIPREDIWYAEGRTYYWKGRVLEVLGRSDEALESWRQAVRSYPLSYYALLSFSRLRERTRQEARTLIRALLERKGKESWRFASRPLFEEPGFQRGLELGRLGLGEAAKREFQAVGLRSGGRKKVDDPEQRELLWLTSLLLDRAGIWRLSHWIARYALEDDWHREWPKGETYRKWLLAYPRAYENILGPEARRAHYPEELLWAITREESAFDPVDESFANAIGLLQMIIPTAKRFAEKGETVTRQTLRDPVYNVRVGLRWLQFLWEMFRHHPALAVAGHNAGEGAVGRWLRERGTLAVDEWVETIPYDETRNYTKRVLASYFAYHWLAAIRTGEDPVPWIGFTLPTPKPPKAALQRKHRHRRK